MNKYRIIICLFTFILSHITSAQSEDIFYKIDQNNGISNNRINAIAQDNNHFIWIATMHGLNRYDGSKTKTFTRQNSDIISDVILDLHIDSKNRIWLATSKGLSLYDIFKKKFRSFLIGSNSSKNTAPKSINCILEDQQGKLWLGTQDGIFIFDPVAKTFLKCLIKTSENKVKHKNILSLAQNSKGIIFAGSYGAGLLKLNPNDNSFSTVISDKFALSHIYDIKFLNDNEIIIGTNGNGAIVYNFKERHFYNFFKKITKKNIPADIIRNINIDLDKNIWLGTDGNGVYQIKKSLSENNKSKIFHYKHVPQRSSSLSGNAVYTIFQDHSKNYWIGTAWNGVNVLSSKKKYDFFFSDAIGKKNTAVLSILKHNNILYFGLDGDGLTSYNTITKQLIQYNPKTNTDFKGGTIQSIYQKGNSLWLGTFANGLIHMNLTTKQFEQYKYDPKNKTSISFNSIRGITEDDNNNLWIATSGGGLNFFDKETKQFYTYKNNENDSSTISSNNLTCIQSIDDKLLIGTSDGGVNLFDIKTKKAIHYQHDIRNNNSICSNNILNLLYDRKGNLWVGTTNDGINKINLKDKTVDRFENQKGLKHQKINGIIEDDNGLIWFITRKNVFNYDYATNQFKDFPNLNGKYRRNSIHKDINGNLYFGNNDGVIKINPKTFSYEKVSPKVIITDFKLFNKDVPIDGKILNKHIIEEEAINLKYHHDVITFEFATLNYPSSKNFEYEIQMENFDKEWRNIGKDNKITYTNLSPGDYIFKVKSRITGTKWSEDFTSITLKIDKPIWLQWWAILGYLLLIGLTFYLFRTYIISWEKMKTNLKIERLAHEKDRELSKLKLEFFTNISHEIRTPVTLILSSINSLLNSESLSPVNQQHNSVTTIQKNSKYLLNLMNNLLDYRKIDSELSTLKISHSDWREFCHEIFLSFKELAEQKNIELKFESEIDNILLWFDKSQMEKVVYNLLSNALKFTENNKRILFKIEEKENFVTLIVKDQGIGISEKHISQIFNRFYQTDKKNHKKNYTGFGLGLSISIHHGTIHVKSKINKGSTFTISLKKGKSHFDSQNINFITDIENDVTNYISTTNTPKQQSEEIIPHKKEYSKDTTVLIVEDNVDIRKYIVSFISKLYPVIEAENGKEGLEIAKKQLPDLIISDIMMPKMDGIEMSKKIKSNINTSHIPILLLTARTSLIHQLEGYNTGAEDYITKPFNETLLISKINSIIRNRQLLHKRIRNDEITTPKELFISEHDQKVLEKLIKLIEDNLESKNLNSKFITSELGISHSVIYRKIKSLTGLSLIEFITEIRLKTAQKLILENNYSVIDACYKVGYHDRKYFSKLFKNHFGKNPSEYKKVHREMRLKNMKNKGPKKNDPK